MNEADAKQMVEEYLLNLYKGAEFSDGDTVMVDDSKTITLEYGWVFFWNTRRYVELGIRKARLIGTPPILVDQETGKVNMLNIDPWAEFPVLDAIARYEVYKQSQGQ